MGKITQAAAFTLAAVAASAAPVAWSQATPDLYDSSGRAVGQFKGDSVLVLYSGQVVRIYTDADWDYAQGHPVSSGLTWKYVPLYYPTADCTSQAYIGTSPTAPTAPAAPAAPATPAAPAAPAAPGAATPAAAPPYTPPAHGSRFLFAPSRQGAGWIAFISQENPVFQQISVQSERQYDGSCVQKSYANLWATPVVTQTGLEIYGVPPFYAR